jgi:hypothetical protein
MRNVLPLSRDQLVADWRSRLAAAEAMASDAGVRPAWLGKVQVRLYRFLLSLYGEGDWRSTERLDSPPFDDARAALLASGAPDLLQQTGKPAKTPAEIRQVLKAVAGAREQLLAAGPFAAGLPPGPWVVVALFKNGADPNRCVNLLRSRQFSVRVSICGRDLAVEVFAADHVRALQLWRAHKLRLVNRQAAMRRLTNAIFWIGAVTMFVAIFAVAAFFITPVRYPNAARGEEAGAAALYALALFLAFLALVCVRPISRLVLAAHRLAMRIWAILVQRLPTRR